MEYCRTRLVRGLLGSAQNASRLAFATVISGCAKATTSGSGDWLAALAKAIKDEAPKENVAACARLTLAVALTTAAIGAKSAMVSRISNTFICPTRL